MIFRNLSCVLLFLVSLPAFVGCVCEKDEVPAYFAQDSYNSLSSHLKINKGQDPPIIEGEYYISPLIYQYGTWKYYSQGQELTPLFIKFFNQNKDNNTVNIEIINSNGLDRTSGVGHISGTGNYFSAYFNGNGVGTGYYYDENYELTPFTQTYSADMIVSGVLNGSSLLDFQYGFVITGKTPEPNPLAFIHVADIGTTMVFKDGDGVSAYTPFPNASSYKGTSQSRATIPPASGAAFIRR